MKIVLDRPVYGYTEIATDPTRERTPGLPGWHGLVLFGEGKRPRRVFGLEISRGGRCLIDTGCRECAGDTLEEALEEMLKVMQP